MAKALDILGTPDGTPEPPDPVDVAFEAMFAVTKDIYQRISYGYGSYSQHTASVGLDAIKKKYDGDERLTAILTMIAALGTNWPAVSSHDLPTIHDQPVVPE